MDETSEIQRSSVAAACLFTLKPLEVLLYRCGRRAYG
jgi:hypothetical protein